MTTSHLPRRDIERLSAYIDGELSPRQTHKLERRLAGDADLRSVLSELRLVSRGLGSLPQQRPPRSFILTPAMVGIKQKRSIYPALRLATSLAAFSLLITVGLDFFTTGTLSGTPLYRFAAEQPMAADGQLLEAAKSESAELEAGLADEMIAGADTQNAEPEADAMAMAAEPALEQQLEAPLEAQIGEAERALEPGEEILLTPPASAEIEQALPALALEAEAPSEAGTGDTELNTLELEDDAAPTQYFLPQDGLITYPWWLRGIQFGLAALTAMLGGLTLWARKNQS